MSNEPLDKKLDVRVPGALINQLKEEANEEYLSFSSHVRRKLSKPHKK